MKKFISMFAFLLAMSFVLSSCEEDEDSTGPSDLKIGIMSATIDGSSWEGQNAIYFNTTNQVSGAKTNGTNPATLTTETVSVLLTTNADPELKSYKAVCFFQTKTGIGTTDVSSWDDTDGSCEITEVSDDEIKGTFSFTGVNDDDGTSKKVTGSFYAQRK